MKPRNGVASTKKTNSSAAESDCNDADDGSDQSHEQEAKKYEVFSLECCDDIPTFGVDDLDDLSSPLTNTHEGGQNSQGLHLTDYHLGQQNEDGTCTATSAYSLAGDPSTPRCAAILISVVTIVTHALFLYGQIAPMWRLRVTAHIDVWANATTTLSRRSFDAIGLNRTENIVVDYDDDVSTFTYGFAIKQLWIAAGLPDKFTSRLAAVLLIAFSGIWPHLKLLLLHLTFLLRYTPQQNKRRTVSLYWLGTFGKWTLADVFVVCALIGIVNLDWSVDPMAIRDGLSAELPTLVLVAKSMYNTTEACTKLLGFECGGEESFFHKAKCWSCITFLNEVYSHPEWAKTAGREVLKGVDTDGGGAVDLRIAGMRGIYPFCLAAILSLLLGVAVDILDHRARRRQAVTSSDALTRQSNNERAFSLNDEMGIGGDPFSWQSLTTTRYGAAASSKGCKLFFKRAMLQGDETWCQEVTAWIGCAIFLIASFFATLLVYLACTVPTMQREVLGAIPKVLEDVLGIAWKRPYSLWTLVEVSGDMGGLDFFLFFTFATFVLIGPILRSLLCVLNLLLPMTEHCHEFFATTINIVGAFCAWEVFAIALYMVDDLIPSVTNTIIHRPICDELSPDTKSCLMIEFNILQSFVGLLVVGGTLLVVVSSVSVKMAFRAIDPYADGDAGGPYFWALGDCPFNQRQRDRPNNSAGVDYCPLDEDVASDTGVLL